MFLAPYIAMFVMATIFSFLMAPHVEYDYPSLKYIAGSYPYTLVRNLFETQLPSPSQTYQQTNRKNVIKSNVPTKSDPVFGDQEPGWKPAKSSQGDDGNFYYSDEYTDGMAAQPFPFVLEYLLFLLYSLRILAINAWADSNNFHRPEATFEYGTGKDDGLMVEAEDKKSESLRRICEVLLLSGIEYGACQSLNQPIAVDQVTAFSLWSKVDEYGIRWKEVRHGADKGCLYFIKADSIPLKMSAMPNEDGTTKLSYYTKNTIGKYCPENNNPEEVELFYKNLIDEIQPAKLTVFLNTKVYGEFTVYDFFEFQMLMDACLIALYKSLSQGGPPTRQALIGFFTLYGIAYGLYYVFVK
ncbi:uncharacterized protein ATC70_009368 [Mucor velutinosus]|uniref:Uncharacterized protein n=1 Tax=Mucor velutinosus TaxID=708070 RepID=A0AAN7DKL5_9FUNG|nr:hypothetical protein ATC70_009368 [Mucor velutinosus]